MSNILAIVGRPNVGKSTLFNRLTQSRKSIVHEQSGVTRDRIYGKSDWNGIEFSVIDTGGYVTNSDDVFEGEIKKQVIIAIEEADIILFVVDVMNGITLLDQEIASVLRRISKPVIVAVNKVDNSQRQFDAAEFYALGLEKLFQVSAINGSGTGDLLDEVVTTFKKYDGEEIANIPKFTIIGRPNVGKSSTINTLMGEERNIVTPIAGTTRDSLHTRYHQFGHDFILIDTAGLRKKGKVQENLEFYSVIRSIRAIEESDVCLLLIDARYGMESQDLNIFNLTIRNRKGVVILVNKWDLIDKNEDSNFLKMYKENIQKKIEPFRDVPIIFTSAITKQRILKAFEKAMHVYQNRQQKIPTSKFNDIMLKAIQKYPPPSAKGKFIKIKYVTQLPTFAPSFAFFCNLPQYIKEPYRRYIENRIRDNWDFTGVPIQVFFRKK